MNWIKFKEKYLLSINFSLLLGIILFGIRKDLNFHSLILIWLGLALIFAPVRELEIRVLRFVGKVNSTIILTAFYLLFFTPFSIFYRVFFKNNAFKVTKGRIVAKDTISDFDRPF